MKKKLALIGICLAGLGVSACGATDSPEGVRSSAPRDIMEMPDGFSSIAHGCEGPNMVYETDNGDGSRSSAPAVVPNDPRCKDQP